MTLNHHRIGHGPEKIVAIHGWLSDHQVYAPTFRHFDPDRYTIAFADCRGYGGSRMLARNFSFDEMAQDVVELAGSLGWDRCHLIGHSMGGTAIQKIAARFPQLVASGIALTPVPASGFPLDAETRQFFERAADDDKALGEIFDILTGKRHGSAFLHDMVTATRRATGRETLLGYLDTWTRADFGDELAGVETPFLVIAGEHDGALGLATIETPISRHLKNVRFKAIASAGHYPMVETPVESVDLIDGFLREIAGA